MTDREGLYRGLSHAAWGYFFQTIDINLNSISILPRFVGWLLVLSAIDKLSGERRELKLLRPLGILAAIWYGMDWLMVWLGSGVSGHILFLDLVMAAVTLYFHFQFLTDLAALAARYQPEGSSLDRRLLRLRTGYTLLLTALSLVGALHTLLPWEGWEWAILGTALVGVALALLIMADLFRLRRCLHDPEE